MRSFLFVLVAVLGAGIAHGQQPCSTCNYGGNSTAQGVAGLMARHRACRHFSGNRGYEGVGTGSTPEQALRNCCYSRNGWAVVDQGVAQGSDGRWYACKRYGR